MIEPAIKFLLVDLPNAKQNTQYVITRYNKSFFYAMLVIELGQAIKQRGDF